MGKKPWIKPKIRVTSVKLEIIDRLSRIEKALLSLNEQPARSEVSQKIEEIQERKSVTIEILSDQIRNGGQVNER